MPLSFGNNTDRNIDKADKKPGILRTRVQKTLNLFGRGDDDYKQVFVQRVQDNPAVQPVLQQAQDIQADPDLNTSVETQAPLEINSLSSLFANLGNAKIVDILSQNDQEIKMQRQNILNKLGVNGDYSKLTIDQKVTRSRFDDIGGKYLIFVDFMLKLLDNSTFLADKNIVLGPSVLAYKGLLQDFREKLTDTNSYLPENFMQFFDIFREYFVKLDNEGITPELLKNIKLNTKMSDTPLLVDSDSFVETIKNIV